MKKNMKKRKTDRQKIKEKLRRKITKQNEDNNIKINKLKKKKPINFKRLNKKNKKNVKFIGALSKKKRIKSELFIFLSILLLLMIRIGFIQFVKGEELQSMAYVQQMLNRSINPKRGIIYDCSRKNNISC